MIITKHNPIHSFSNTWISKSSRQWYLRFLPENIKDRIWYESARSLWRYNYKLTIMMLYAHNMWVKKKGKCFGTKTKRVSRISSRQRRTSHSWDLSLKTNMKDMSLMTFNCLLKIISRILILWNTNCWAHLSEKV